MPATQRVIREFCMNCPLSSLLLSVGCGNENPVHRGGAGEGVELPNGVGDDILQAFRRRVELCELGRSTTEYRIDLDGGCALGLSLLPMHETCMGPGRAGRWVLAGTFTGFPEETDGGQGPKHLSH